MKETLKDQYQIISSKGSTINLSEIEVEAMDIIKVGKKAYHVIHESKSMEVQILACSIHDKTMRLKIDGAEMNLSLRDHFDRLVEKMGLNERDHHKVENLKAPMPGLVLEVLVGEGQKIDQGQQILILEAMKMENIIKSPIDTRVAALKVKKGDTVEKGQVLLYFD